MDSEEAETETEAEEDTALVSEELSDTEEEDAGGSEASVGILAAEAPLLPQMNWYSRSFCFVKLMIRL